MIPEILRFAREVKQQFNIRPGRVLEVGSYNVNGTIRDVFQQDAESYIGIDIIPGPGVDQVLPSHEIRRVWSNGTFDTVICNEMLEHDPMPWLTVAQMRAVLKRDGVLFVSTPIFGFPLHRFPKDYYRYGEDAFHEFIFRKFSILRMETVYGGEHHPVICCIGRKSAERKLAVPPEQRVSESRCDDLTAARTELDDLGMWPAAVAKSCEKLCRMIPDGETFILADEAQWHGMTDFGSRSVRAFPDVDGQYGGRPADDAQAISELARLSAAGARFIVFAWPAFWWLEYYSGLRQLLAVKHRRLFEDDRIIVFELLG
jgi:hypothetical protein